MDLWNNTDKFVAGYLTKFEGYLDLTDAGWIDSDGCDISFKCDSSDKITEYVKM